MRLPLVFFALLTLVRLVSGQDRRDFFIPVGRSDSLDATLFRPTGKTPPRGFPAIIFVHGFSLSKDWDTSNARTYARRGYVTLCYSVRGHGKSSGLSTIMSRQERSDLRSVVRWVRRAPGVNPALIGVTGGSQGGLHALWAACGIPGVSAASADVITPHWASGMCAGGSFRRTLISLLTSTQVRYAPVRDSLLDDLRHDRFESFLRRFAGPRNITLPQRARVPLALFLKWQDHYFTATDGLEAYSVYPGPRRLYLGTVGHFSDWDAVEDRFQNALVSDWFARYLKGAAPGPDMPQVVVAISSLPIDEKGRFSWTRRSGIPERGNDLRLYLGNGGKLLMQPSGLERDSVVVRNTYRHSWYTFDTALVEGFRGPRFDAALPRCEVSFTSDPLPGDLVWFGRPRLEAWVSSPSPQFPLHTQIAEVDSSGRVHMVNRISYTAREWTPGEERKIMVEGIPHGHRFSRGSRIQVTLMNIDAASRPGLEGYPFVLPVLASAEAIVLLDAMHPSCLVLPVGPTTEGTVNTPSGTADHSGGTELRTSRPLNDLRRHTGRGTGR